MTVALSVAAVVIYLVALRGQAGPHGDLSIPWPLIALGFYSPR